MFSVFKTKKPPSLLQTPYGGRPFSIFLEHAASRAQDDKKTVFLDIAKKAAALPPFTEEALHSALRAFSHAPTSLIFFAALFAREAFVLSVLASFKKGTSLYEPFKCRVLALLHSIRDLRLEDHLSAEEFLALLETLEACSPSALWRSQAQFLLSACLLPNEAFCLTEKRLFILTDYLKNWFLNPDSHERLIRFDLLKTGIHLLLPNTLEASTHNRFSPAAEVLAPLQKTLRALLLKRSPRPRLFERMTVRENHLSQKTIDVTVHRFRFRLPAAFDTETAKGLTTLIARVLSLSYANPLSKRFYVLDNLQRTRSSAIRDAGPLGVFLPIESLIQAELLHEETIPMLCAAHCIYRTDKEATAANALILRTGSYPTVNRATGEVCREANKKTAHIEGIIFLNRDRGDAWEVSRALTRTLRAEEKLAESLAVLDTEPESAAGISLSRLAQAKANLENLLRMKTIKNPRALKVERKSVR